MAFFDRDAVSRADPDQVAAGQPNLTWLDRIGLDGFDVLLIAICLLVALVAVAAIQRHRAAIGPAVRDGIVEALVLSGRATRALRRTSDDIWRRVEKRLNTPS